MSAFEAAGATWWVTLIYIEPTYAAHNGMTAVPYRWTFEVEAPDADHAVLEAIRQFRAAATESRVGWVREIVTWDVAAAPVAT